MSAHLCPTCGRRPSERHSRTHTTAKKHWKAKEREIDCPDPIHDLADAAPELAEALVKDVPQAVYNEIVEECGATMAKAAAHAAKTVARALLAKLEVPRER